MPTITHNRCRLCGDYFPVTQDMVHEFVRETKVACPNEPEPTDREAINCMDNCWTCGGYNEEPKAEPYLTTHGLRMLEYLPPSERAFILQCVSRYGKKEEKRS